MGLRIRTNIASLNAQRAVQDTQRSAGQQMERLASGYRINKAADDAAGLAISEKLRAKIRSADQARRNAADGLSLIQTTEGSYNEISNILTRLRELAVQASTDTLSNLERSFANKEYVGLVDEIERIANATEFNGIKVLQGPEALDGQETLGIHIGTGDAKVANVDDIHIDLKMTKIDLEETMPLGRESEIGPAEPEEDFSRQEAADKLTQLDRHLTLVQNNRAYLGSKQNRLNSTINNLEVQLENMASTKSRIKDADFANETALFTQSQILSQSGVSVLSQANTWPELAISLLR